MLRVAFSFDDSGRCRENEADEGWECSVWDEIVVCEFMQL